MENVRGYRRDSSNYLVVGVARSMNGRYVRLHRLRPREASQHELVSLCAVGERECPALVYGDGQQSRDFTYVDDIARGTIAGLRPLGYEVINLGSDTPVVLMDAIQLVERLVGKRANLVFKPRHAADVIATWADINKAEQLLRWRPGIHIEAGIAHLVHWYQTNQDWAAEVAT